MDNPRPNQDPSLRPDAQHVKALAAVANEQILLLSEEQELNPLVTGEAVAHITQFMADGQPRLPQEIRAMLSGQGFEGPRFKAAILEQSLEVAERTLWHHDVPVIWHKQTGPNSRHTYYELAVQYYDEPTQQLLEALRTSDDPIPAQLLEGVFGVGMSKIFPRGQVWTGVKKVGGTLRTGYMFPNHVIGRCLNAIADSGLVDTEATSVPGLSRFVAKDLPPRQPLPQVLDVISGGQASIPSQVELYKIGLRENPYRELAVLAVKRLCWVSARGGVPLDALYRWIEEDGLGPTTKAEVVRTLCDYGYVSLTETEKGSTVTLNEALQATDWRVLEAKIRRHFDT